MLQFLSVEIFSFCLYIPQAFFREPVTVRCYNCGQGKRYIESLGMKPRLR